MTDSPLDVLLLHISDDYVDDVVLLGLEGDGRVSDDDSLAVLLDRGNADFVTVLSRGQECHNIPMFPVTTSLDLFFQAFDYLFVRVELVHVIR